jgi:hypothetical protein
MQNRWLDLSVSHGLAGTIPSTLSGLAALVHLDLGLTSITGTIPPVLNRLTDLTYAQAQAHMAQGALLALFVR